MDWKDIKNVVGTAAPVLGSLLGGPAGGAIGTAIAGVLGVNDNADEVAKALQANPEQLVLLKKYEMDHAVELQKLQLQDAQMYLTDVQDARSRQVEHEKSTGKTDINLYVLAWTIVCGFFALIGLLIFIKLPEASNDIVFMLFGTLSAGFGSVMQYFFGSSKGSAEKTAQLATIAKR